VLPSATNPSIHRCRRIVTMSRHCCRHIVVVSSSSLHCGHVVVAIASSSLSSHCRGVIVAVLSSLLHCRGVASSRRQCCCIVGVVALSVLSCCQCCHVVGFVTSSVLSCCWCCWCCCCCCHCIIAVLVVVSWCWSRCCRSVIFVVTSSSHHCRVIAVASPLCCHCCYCHIAVSSCHHGVIVSMDGPGCRTCHTWPALAHPVHPGYPPCGWPRTSYLPSLWCHVASLLCRRHHRIVAMSPCHVVSSSSSHRRMVAMSLSHGHCVVVRMVAVSSSHGRRVVVTWLPCCCRRMVVMSLSSYGCRVVLCHCRIVAVVAW